MTTGRRTFLALGGSAGAASVLGALPALAESPWPTPPGTCTPQVCTVPTTARPRYGTPARGYGAFASVTASSRCSRAPQSATHHSIARNSGAPPASHITAPAFI